MSLFTRSGPELVCLTNGIIFNTYYTPCAEQKTELWVSETEKTSNITLHLTVVSDLESLD